jgi:hypothetical protein
VQRKVAPFLTAAVLHSLIPVLARTNAFQSAEIDSADVSASDETLKACIHSAAAAPGGLVMIDSARITEFSPVRPIDVVRVERILAGLAVSQKFRFEHAVIGRIIALTGGVYILDGTHRCMPMLIGR